MTGNTDGRSLTQGEMSMLREVYGPRIPFPSIRIYARRWHWPLPNDRAMSPNGNMYMPGEFSADDYAAGNVSLYHKGVFIHEGAHLYQWYVLGWIVWARGPLDRDYIYKLIPGQRYDKYGLEQMGMIAEHYYVLKHGGRPRDLPDKTYTAASYAAIMPVR